MKILIDARSLGSNPGGIGIYTYDFILELHKDSRFELTLLTDLATSQQMLRLAQLEIPIITYGKEIRESAQVLKYFRFVQDSLDFYKPDLFWEPNNLIPVKLLRYEGRFLITIHDIFPITDPETYGTIYPVYFKHCLKKTLKQADMIIYNSVESKVSMERAFPQARDLSHYISYIIVHKPNVEHQPVSPDVYFKDVKIDGQDYFLYIGTIERRKGADLLLHAYETYRSHGGTKLLYLGGAIREPEIQELYQTISNRTPGIHALGYVDDEQKDILYRNCSGFVFPSRAEGFGIPIIEAMHYNKPILASNLSIFKETSGDAINYFDINTSQEEQINNLANAMLNLNSADLAAYKTITARYTPEVLGRGFCDYIYSAVTEE